MKLIYSLLILAFFPFATTAQEEDEEKFYDYDYKMTSDLKNYDRNRIMNQDFPKPTINKGVANYKYVVGKEFQVSVYIAIDDQKTPVVNLSKIDNFIGNVEEAFKKTGMRFSVCKKIIFQDPTYADIKNLPNCNNLEQMMRDYYTPNTINLYFISSLEVKAGEQTPNYTHMPDTLNTNDYIILTSLDKQLGIHTFGHFFGLYHTHESNLWGEEVVVNKDKECYSSGDLICETPAEPELDKKGLVLQDCEYTSKQKIENGDFFITTEPTDDQMNIYVPSVTNYMSHIPPQCSILFTNEQLFRMAEIYRTFYQYLR